MPVAVGEDGPDDRWYAGHFALERSRKRSAHGLCQKHQTSAEACISLPKAAGRSLPVPLETRCSDASATKGVNAERWLSDQTTKRASKPRLPDKPHRYEPLPNLDETVVGVHSVQVIFATCLLSSFDAAVNARR